jgi:hypothetical protein
MYPLLPIWPSIPTNFSSKRWTLTSSWAVIYICGKGYFSMHDSNIPYYLLEAMYLKYMPSEANITILGLFA